MILDIGLRTAENYAKEIEKANTIYVKGPAGAYETEGFDLGTRILLKAVTSSAGFSLVGGGHSLAAVEKFVNKKDLSYVSLSGGALIEYLCGKKLPGIEALKMSHEKHK
jgi:phosphoglycerate kinase